MTPETANTRVAYGASVFDTVFGPDWDELIDVATLNIGSCTECALAQVSARHPIFAQATSDHLVESTKHGPDNEDCSPFDSGWQVCLTTSSYEELIRMGCNANVATNQHDGEIPMEFEVLTNAWLQLIAERRNKRASVANGSTARVLEDA